MSSNSYIKATRVALLIFIHEYNVRRMMAVQCHYFELSCARRRCPVVLIILIDRPCELLTRADSTGYLILSIVDTQKRIDNIERV